MNEQKSFAGLLKYIAMQVGCVYITDLHMINLSVIKRAISPIPPHTYDLREWEDAVHYITGKAMRFETPEQAKNYLLTIELTHYPNDAETPLR